MRERVGVVEIRVTLAISVDVDVGAMSGWAGVL
jgi:hypothetical protein